MRIFFAFILLTFTASIAAAQDLKPDADQNGYYYPPVTSSEAFKRELIRADDPADRALRQLFLAQLRKGHAEVEGQRRVEIFAKGKAATNLIIVALDDEVFRTLFRARAVLAGLTTDARSTEVFSNSTVADRATWFDLLKALGFEDIVISDGATWSHLVVLR
jgi:hypothetical protein